MYTVCACTCPVANADQIHLYMHTYLLLQARYVVDAALVVEVSGGGGSNKHKKRQKFVTRVVRNPIGTLVPMAGKHDIDIDDDNNAAGIGQVRIADEFLFSNGGSSSGSSGSDDDELRRRQLPSKRRLANDIVEANAADPMYGPYHEKQRHAIGIEYEVALEFYLKETGTRRTEKDACMLCTLHTIPAKMSLYGCSF